ncbi:hypothetical protein [Desulfovibrio sp.]|jgi:hypothetical protein|uniref:hypothetical protein n=1 Tax=Desulfovibrio sp. TaxID=885 RepID=UPI003AAB2929
MPEATAFSDVSVTETVVPGVDVDVTLYPTALLNASPSVTPITRIAATASEPNVLMRWHFFKTDRYRFTKFPMALFVIVTPPLPFGFFHSRRGRLGIKKGRMEQQGRPMTSESFFLHEKYVIGNTRK